MADDKREPDSASAQPPVVDEPNQRDAPAAERLPARTVAQARPRRNLAVALLALLVALLSAVAAYYLWQQLQHTRTQIADLRAQTRDATQQSADTFARLQAQLADQIQQQSNADARLQNLENSVNHVRQLAQRDQNDWVLAEAAYLMRVANERLLLIGDTATALAALSAADARLRDLGDPGLTEVRAQLAREIGALKALPKIDVAGMAVELQSLAQQVAQLPNGSSQRANALGGTAAGQNSGAAAPQRGWGDALKGVWKELGALVVVRRHDRPIEPLLSPQQEFLLRQNLRLKLQAARVALIQRNEPLYRNSLQDASAWLRQRFDVKDAAVASMLERLQALAQPDIHPQLPDISASLRLLRKFMQQRHSDRAAATSDTPPTPNAAAPGKDVAK